MDNKEILKYVNSKDVRDHLDKINYNFSPLEAIWLIANHHKITLEDRITAWQAVINSMPDCEYNRNGMNINSIFQMLSDHISLLIEKRLELLSDTPDTFYEYEINNESFKNPAEKQYIYRARYDTYQKCYTALKEMLSNDRFHSGLIRKMTTTYSDHLIAGAEYNSKGDIKDVFFPTGNEPLPMQIFLWDDIQLPVPFQKGDIVYNPYSQSGCDIFVIDNYTSIPSIWAEEYCIHPNDICGYSHPYTDFSGLRISNSTLSYPSDYEYCPDKLLTGRFRAYTVLRDYLKGKISLAELLNIYNTILMEELNKDIHKYAIPEEQLRRKT